jgi:hypothetical protein
MLGNGWSELVVLLVCLESLFVFGSGPVWLSLYHGFGWQRACVVSVAGILTTGCILGLDLAR